MPLQFSLCMFPPLGNLTCLCALATGLRGPTWTRGSPLLQDDDRKERFSKIGRYNWRDVLFDKNTFYNVKRF